jgi:mono/diheme cytochrome c family protein
MSRYLVSAMLIAIVSAAALLATRTDDAARAADAGGAQAGTAPYTVHDGNKVDQKTLDGWKTWRALACERCHGAEQEGLVGPSLVNSLKTMSKDDFHTTVINGRAEKGMPPWGASDMMVKNWEGLYDYLKGRSDGAIKPGHLYPIGQ